MLPFRWLVSIGIVLLPLVWALWLTEVVSSSFARLGLSPAVTTVVLLGSLVGGWINIPIWHRRIHPPTSWDGGRFSSRGLVLRLFLAGPVGSSINRPGYVSRSSPS